MIYFLHKNNNNKKKQQQQKKNAISDDTLTILFHNVRSRSKHVDGIVGDDSRIINNDIIGFAETQINQFFQYSF